VEQVSGHYVEFTPAGDSVRAITVSPPRYLDNHDLWITRGPDGSDRFHFFTYDFRTADLRPIGGAAGVRLAGHQLVRTRADRSVEFEWNAWDRLAIEEWVELPRPDPSDSVGRDFDHPNSLAFDRDGNYIVSFRNLAQVMKIDAKSGEILWRLGGLKSDFSILDDPFGGFSAQHSATILPDGNLLLYDNGTSHQPPETRAVEYALDSAAGTARLVWEHRQQPPVYTQAVGSVQRLASGNTLVGYGWIGRASEVGADGSVKWAAELMVDGQPALVYRLVRISSALLLSLVPT
jgi:outer membrane protein assembly factor BamB